MNLLQTSAKNIITLGIALLLILSCSVKPKAIDYGNTACHYCSMTIVDKQHAAQVVTDKGKAYNFDAIECMLNHLKEESTAPIALYLVNDYLTPGELIDAQKSAYLISEAIPSPMGAFLTALQGKKEAQALVDQQGGKIYTWEEIQEKFNQGQGAHIPN